jgi:CBS domain-containing protein
MKVADIMTRKVVTVSPELSVFELAALLVRHRISAAPVIGTDGRIIGIVSESDLLRRPETGTERRVAIGWRHSRRPTSLPNATSAAMALPSSTLCLATSRPSASTRRSPTP